jgi:CRISPR-associated protein Csb2
MHEQRAQPIFPPLSSNIRFRIARLALDAPVLPLVIETLPLAEQARRALLSICKHLARRDNPGLADADVWPLSPAFWGKDEQGRPRTGHEHAFFLPADEDGDGRLDHLTVFAPMGFNALEVRALDRLRQLRWGEGDPLRLLLVGLGNRDNLVSPLLVKAASWISATPFIVTRYPKRRGRKRDQPEDYSTPHDFARHVLRQELQRFRERRPELPALDQIKVDWVSDGIGRQKLRPIQFRCFRQKRSDDGGRRPSGAFRIVFPRPVAGPICLGHSCHFGLGLFLPAQDKEAAIT